MRRQDWAKGRKEDPIMSWGSAGDEIKDKTTGETFSLRRKDPDGWVVQSHNFNGVRGGSWLKFDFKEMAARFTEPKG